jgi:SAM-dependent methyltransferase
VGCGQGQFTDLLAEAAELPVTGVDVSPQAITSAIDTYPHCGFAVMDALALPSCTYAMIFARSLSLYNTSGFASDRTVTNRLVTALQPGGVLIWLYNVTPGRAPSGWRHHSLRDVRAHFAAYGTAQVAFSLRLDAWLPSRVFWSPLWTRIAYRLARLFRMGGELIVILTAPDSPARSRSRSWARRRRRHAARTSAIFLGGASDVGPFTNLLSRGVGEQGRTIGSTPFSTHRYAVMRVNPARGQHAPGQREWPVFGLERPGAPRPRRP